jgi:hypothetical protein
LLGLDMVDYVSTTSFPIPEFKIGTLDALVQQAEELSKLEASCESSLHSQINTKLETYYR